MAEFESTTSLNEAEFLKRAAHLVGKGEIDRAIKLLEEALKAHLRSEKLLSTLSNLHNQLGEYDIARKYTEAAFYHSTPTSSQTVIDLPGKDDFAFLAEQSSELVETEYSFDTPKAELKKSLRKTLRLKTKMRPTSEEDNGNVKVSYNGKHRHVLSGITHPSNDADSTDSIIPFPQSNNPEESERSDFSKPERSGTPAKKRHEYQYDETEQDEGVLDEPVDLDRFCVLIDEADSDEGGFGVEAFSDIDEYSDGSEGALSFFDNEAEFYAFWDDEASDNQQEENADNGVLDNSLTYEDRARLIAVECIIEFGWHTRKLPFLVEVFSGAGWGNSRKALEREVQAGATIEELELAFEVKKFWQDSSRYWITFSKAWVSGESADATYKHCSWKQGLRLVRLFDGVPTFEEVHDFLETEFEYWYHNRVLRLCFPAFNKYLFNYRLHSRNINSMFGGFDLPVAHDSLNASWSYHTHSDEMLILKEIGIDLVGKFAPKSYFTSDLYTNEYLLEIYRTCAKSQQRGAE